MQSRARWPKYPGRFRPGLAQGMITPPLAPPASPA